MISRDDVELSGTLEALDFLLGFFVTDVAGNVGADWEEVTISE